jgi:hypothetical protein
VRCPSGTRLLLMLPRWPSRTLRTQSGDLADRGTRPHGQPGQTDTLDRSRTCRGTSSLDPAVGGTPRCPPPRRASGAAASRV